MSRLVITNWRDNAHPQAGGAEACCGEVAKWLAAEGHEVVFLTAAVEGRPAAEVVDDYTVIRRGGQFTVYFWALWWLLRHRRHVDGVIDSQNGIPFFTPLVVRSRTPVILMLHHVHQKQFASYFSPPVALLGRWLERVACRHVYRDRLLAAMSPSTRRDARRALGLRGPIHVVPPGWRLSGQAGYVPACRADRPRIVCVGRMVHHKRYELVVAAMATVLSQRPDAELHLVGDGPERTHLERLVSELHIDGAVHFHGALPSAQRDDLLRTAWLTINASAGEGWGLSVVEANAMGIPAVAYRVPGLRDSIRHGQTGWLVHEGGDLGAGVLEALKAVSTQAAAAEWAERCVSWVNSFSWDETARLLSELLVVERDRLAQPGPDRRLLSDLAVKVTMPAAVVPADWKPSFRKSDRYLVGAKSFVALLPGCDFVGARSALARTGLDLEGPTPAPVRLDLARPTDHVAINYVTARSQLLDAAPWEATTAAVPNRPPETGPGLVPSRLVRFERRLPFSGSETRR